MADLGANVEEVELPGMTDAFSVGTLTIAVEGAAYHATALRERPGMFSDELRATLELGGFYQAIDYVNAQRLRRHLATRAGAAMAGFDAVVMPAAAVAATPIAVDPPGHAVLRARNTVPFNLLGLPAISVPCGFTGAGLPIGLQIVGKAFDEARVLRIAHAYEQATPWHRRHPPL